MGPNEAALMKALEAEPGAMRRQARAWDKAAEDLRLVAERVRTKQAQLQAAWPSGDDGAAATAAFATLAENVETQATRMDRAAESYRTAADTVTTAKSNYGSLPTPPAGGAALGEGATPRQVEHADEANAAGKAEREAKAGEYLRQMNDGFRDASAEMKAAAPFDQGIKEIEEDDHTDTQGGTGGGSYTSPGSGGTGPYSTSTSGTFAGSAVGISMLGGRPVLGGTIRPGNGQGVGNDDATADGVVGGTVPGADGGTGATGSAGGSVGGGSAGLGGGTGGAMGAGGAAALLGGGKGLLGKVGGGAAGRAAGAAGASARAGTSGASAKGGAIGGKSAGASKGVLGGRSAGTTGGAGQTAGGRGGAAGGRGGMAGGQQAGARGGAAGGRAGGAAGRSAGAAGRPTAGGMQAGGRSTAAGGSGKAAGGSAAGRSGGAAGAKGTPGSSNATGARNGGAGTRGAAGRGTGPGSTGQGGRGTQRGSDDAVDKRKAMVMAEDWLDDDDVAPDVIQ